VTTFSETTIKALPVPTTGSKFCGFAGAMVQGKPIPRGLGVVVTANGVRSFVINYNLRGRERRYTIGRVGDWNVPMAIDRARELRRQIDDGIDPLDARKAIAEPEREKTVADIWAAWEKSRARDGKRDPVYQRQSFQRSILPAIGDVPFKELRKSQVADLRDKVQDSAGPVSANRALAYLSAVLNWQAAREDDWEAPRLGRLKTTEQSRERILTEDEIRALWPAFDQLGTFGVFCKLLLLTSQRRSDIAGLRWSEIDLEARTVRVPAERYKTGISHEFPLSAPAAAILEAISRRRDDRVFASIQYSRDKLALDKLVPIGERWTLHDLRRTSASLMFANGVTIDDIDRVQGHVIRGMAQTYVRGQFMDQKRRAVDTLARAIDRILNPSDAKVVSIRA
jgi:integrase